MAGRLGLNAGRVADLLEPSAFVFNLGASLLWTLIDSRQRQAQVGAASARIDAAQATFDKAVLGALEDTEGTLAPYSRTQLQTDSLFIAATAASPAQHKSPGRGLQSVRVIFSPCWTPNVNRSARKTAWPSRKPKQQPVWWVFTAHWREAGAVELVTALASDV